MDYIALLRERRRRNHQVAAVLDDARPSTSHDPLAQALPAPLLAPPPTAAAAPWPHDDTQDSEEEEIDQEGRELPIAGK